jgi:hypothetical protein
MNQSKKDRKRNENEERSKHQIKLPGFVVEEEIGLGDAVKKFTHALGVKACGGCERRAAALNRWMTFTR